MSTVWGINVAKMFLLGGESSMRSVVICLLMENYFGVYLSFAGLTKVLP